MKKLSVKNSDALFEAISASRALYLPIEKAGKVDFYPWSKDEKVRLDALQTTRSAKDLFFPQSECFAKFKLDKNAISVDPVAPADEKFVVFGVRACDARSFELLDKVFLADPVDVMYQTRRANGTIVTLACAEPEETCFCMNFGIDASAPGGDARATFVGGSMILEALTEKGEKLLDEVSTALEDASKDDEKALADEKERIAGILKKLPFSSLPLDNIKKQDELEAVQWWKWGELSQGCLGCGTCTFVCPTCQCYDIRDFDTGHGINRFRCWDSCMFWEFTQAAGHNPRLTQMERFRQRFMHKLVYFPKNNGGDFSCVGCGRCVRKCPSALNIVKVIKELGGSDNE
ncbi:MAG: 4Fe-4S dicluster domain-containing protein [Clostridia bacterium]|nr:4Fe-4S dicluster domain-containing protein [Clostridia bacterium]